VHAEQTCILQIFRFFEKLDFFQKAKLPMQGVVATDGVVSDQFRARHHSRQKLLQLPLS
jgi:hypothetical protein